MKEKLSPVIIGVSQFTQHKDTAVPLDPHALMAKVCRAAVEDTGAKNLSEVVDSVNMLYLTTPTLKDAPQNLCDAVGLKPKETRYSAVGGNTPQMLINRAARRIASGEIRGILITGAEAHYSVNRALRRGEVFPHWPNREDPEKIEGDTRNGNSDLEIKYGLNLPIYMYPLLETSLRAASGLSIDVHKNRLGKLYEKLSQISSRNPYSWDRNIYSVSEIMEPTSDNRFIGYPYTKRLVANQHVDMSVALLMIAEGEAERLGIDRDRWVYPIGGAELENIWHVSRRPSIHESPAVGFASRIALDQAGLTLDDIGVFDLYSCFPSAIEAARREIGISGNYLRDFSVTGGLAFFGGPFSSYSLHAICSVVERIRADRELKAMVSATGWYNTKYSVGIYGAQRPRNVWKEFDTSDIQREIQSRALPPPVEMANGPFTVEAYTVVHDRDGKPEKGIAMGRLKDGRRAMAHIEGSTEILEQFERAELVGVTGEVRFNGETELNKVQF